MKTSTESFKGHTPGPWACNLKMGKGHRTITGNSGSQKDFEVCEVWSKPNIETANANMALLAAAPTLLAQRDRLAEALRKIVNRWDRGIDALTEAVEISEARSALAELEGR